MPHI
jgi:hypothetical protein